MVRLNPRSLRVLNQDGAADTIHSVEGVDHVGAYLREARENTERSVADVAQTLRIRRVYLQAIEDGRFDELPGTTYAVGFVQSYATYLRLDVPTIVERFKREASGIDSAQELEFPTPVPEGRFPGGVVVTLCLVLAAAGFGGWYWWQNQNSIVVERVPPPPESVTGASDPPVDRDATVSETSAAATVTADAPSPAPAVSQTAVAQEDGPPVVIYAAEPASVPEPVPAVTPEIAAETVPEPEPTPPVIARPTGPNTELNVGVALPPQGSIAALPSIPAGSASTEGATDGRTYGTVNRDARIVLTARDAGTWVQVMDSQENALLTQMLQPGDRYLVPDRPGLRLRTNNAGGLDIRVDDVAVPTIGRRGDVRHDVRLDPDLLKSGAAVIE
jgi:cytoskeletal protein RodZ